jgi:hypothetical protein
MAAGAVTAINHGRVPGGQVGQLVRAPKTSELIAAQLRRQIVRGTVRPGQKLPPETQLRSATTRRQGRRRTGAACRS